MSLPLPRALQLFWSKSRMNHIDLVLILVVSKMVSATHLSDFKDFIKSNNKIPPYAKNFKKEYLFIRGINKEFEYFIDNMDKISTYEFFHNTNVDRITKLIKIFLRGQEKGKFKDISGLYFREYDILNII